MKSNRCKSTAGAPKETLKREEPKTEKMLYIRRDGMIYKESCSACKVNNRTNES